MKSRRSNLDKLSKQQKIQAEAVADVGRRLRKAAAKLYPGIDWKQWTPKMWDDIYTEAEREWANEKRSR